MSLTTLFSRLLATVAALLLSFSALAADINFDQLKGKVVYLDFWASWCGPCRDSFPWMEAMHKKYAAQGLEIIAVNLDQEPELAQKFLKQYAPDFRIEYDAKGEMAGQFGVDTMPTSFVIGRDGKARKKHKGFHAERKAAYETEIRTLLEE
ncbi:MAG: redoxin [Oceanospirillaceae bacterium]|nr:redoxin [Oceanospirillaceae bacterium]MBT11447.1 redoxin [Oceanospirillaceae bacterium]|tara:strand:+ start:137101 stop:137553 length:453 start_codon:yes stop_codon:yes gene_type:complete